MYLDERDDPYTAPQLFKVVERAEQMLSHDYPHTQQEVRVFLDTAWDLIEVEQQTIAERIQDYTHVSQQCVQEVIACLVDAHKTAIEREAPWLPASNN